MNSNHLKICANLSMMFKERDFLDRFSAASDCGFNSVEIQFPYAEPLKNILEVQAKNKLQIALINIPAGDLMEGGEGLACSPKRQNEFKKAMDDCIEYAEGLGVNSVNVLPGRCLEENLREHYFEQYLVNLDYAADLLKSASIRAVFEAINIIDMPNFLVHSYEQMLKIMADLNHSNVLMQYDIYHMSMMGENIANNLQTAIDKIGHIQFADYPGRAEPGKGSLDFHSLFNQLNQLKYTGWVGAEYNPSVKTIDTLDWMDDFSFRE